MQYHLPIKICIEIMSKNQSQSILLSIPVDQCQHVLSYMTAVELLTLSLVSKQIKAMVLHTHTLIVPQSTSTFTSPIGMDNNLRRSIANIHNLDPISSVTYNTRRASLPASILSSSSQKNKKEEKEFELTDVMRLTNLLRKFQNLRTIRLCDVSSMEDNFIPIINQFYRHANSSLVRLECHNVRIVKDGGHLLYSFPNNRLSHMELHGTMFCSYKVLKSFTMSDNLQTLKLSGCRALVDLDVEDIVTRTSKSSSSSFTSPMKVGDINTNTQNIGTGTRNTRKVLNHLSLENCSKLLSPRIQSQSLERLSLSKNPLLRNISGVHCPNLIELDLSYCSSLGAGAVEALLQTSSYLQKLNLSGCRGFDELCISSQHMSDLDLGMCMMHRATIACPELTSLNIGLCVKLQTLRLELDTIKEIDLSMLPLKELHLYAPSTSKLNASGCCRLVDIERMECPNLMNVDICGTSLNAETFQVHGKTKVKAGGEAYDWVEPF